MTLSVHRTTEWPYERIARYGPDITREMKRLAERFPDDATLDSLFDDYRAGRVELWLVLKGDAFVSMGFTQIETIDATGIRYLGLIRFAGKDIKDTMPLITEAEVYARSLGITHVRVIGREGWGRMFKPYGYSPLRTVFEKKLEEGAA